MCISCATNAGQLILGSTLQSTIVKLSDMQGKKDGKSESAGGSAQTAGREERGGKLMNLWIFADLDMIIDSYSEPPKEET